MNRPEELKDIEYFTVPALPHYMSYIKLPAPEPDYGVCQVCNNDVLLFRLVKTAATCYSCYIIGRKSETI